MGGLLVAGGCLLVLGMFVASGISSSRKRRLPRTWIRYCREGEQVKIVGRVVPLQQIVSPSGRDCIAYYVHASFGPRHVTRMAVTAFVVDDGTGQAIVDSGRDGQPTGLDLDSDLKEHRLLNPLDGNDLPGIELLGLTKVEMYSEGALLAGEKVCVFGEVSMMATPGTTATSGYRDGSVSTVRIVRPQKGWFMISNKTGMVGDV